jgi:competence protein ComEC
MAASTSLVAKLRGRRAGAGLGQGFAQGLGLAALRDRFVAAVGAAIALERAERRLFLWLPVAAGAGVVLYLQAAREPSMLLAAALALGFGLAAWALHAVPAAFAVLALLSALFCGLTSAAWRSARVAGPVLDRIRILDLEGRIEQMDFRRAGARFVLRVTKAGELGADATPTRVRLTTIRRPPFEAGATVRLKARLLPPAHAVLPGGYDFARDAWFAGLGAVGNVLGRMEAVPEAAPAGLWTRAMAALDRSRNALAARVDAVVGGEAGAIAAAMVTGKRDLLSEEEKTVIREAGIFHIITIAGVQMSLVAAIFYGGLRRLLALSRTLALRYPIKKWSAAAAILAACVYDLATGSRVGTERALFMTTIMLAAVMLDRQALTMRNLALAAALVVLVEPESILGASFQLSFAAVAALAAVYEGRMRARAAARAALRDMTVPTAPEPPWRRRLATLRDAVGHGPGALLFATFCATTATASFMAYDFHELSPYVLIGNPLTLAIIEFFAVPGALLGTALYPLGLDGFVWSYVGLGIRFVMWAARLVGSLPGATLHVPAFAPWSLPFLALALLSAVLWRSWLMRATALPLAALGLCGALGGPRLDVAVAATGEAVALRQADGQLVVLGQRPSVFAAEQWLRADGDGRLGKLAAARENCDRLGCVGLLPDGRALALDLDAAAFAEDCTRAFVLVTPLYAPDGCAAPVVIDRGRLAETGAVALRLTGDGVEVTTARAVGEDRPWSPAPKPRWGRASNPVPEGEGADGGGG